jgi:sterol O-acyltransferase
MRATLQKKLKQLEAVDPVATPSATTPKFSSLSTSYLDFQPTANDMNQRRHSRSMSIDHGDSSINVVAAAIEAGFVQPFLLDRSFGAVLSTDIFFCNQTQEGMLTCLQ